MALLWTDRQRKWLHDHVAQVEGYRRSATDDRRPLYVYEVAMLSAVQDMLRTGRTAAREIKIWEWWAYWYSVSLFSTRIAPWGPHLEQMVQSQDFKQQLLQQRDSALAVLKKHEKHPIQQR